MDYRRNELRPTAIYLSVAPVALPVSLAEFKLHARIDIDDDDAICTSMITAATNQCETETERSLMEQTWVALFSNWSRCLRLSRPPLTSVTSLEYLDIDDTWTTVDAANYYVHSEVEPAFIQLKDTFNRPSLSNSELPIRVTYEAGYGDATDVPENAKRAICILAAHYYEQRQIVSMGQTPMPVQRTFRSLVDSIRVPSMQ